MDFRMVLILVFVPLAIAIYLLPSIISITQNHPQKRYIILTNVIGGLLGGLGWIVALIWCFVAPRAGTLRGNVSE